MDSYSKEAIDAEIAKELNNLVQEIFMRLERENPQVLESILSAKIEDQGMSDSHEENIIEWRN
jgi:hypothetical protein